MLDIDLLFKNGQEEFFDIIKKALYQENENIFEDLDFYNDTIYGESLLFSYLNRPGQKIMELTQILFGYYTNDKKPTDFTVISDQKGWIYLPNYGNLKTNHPNKKFKLEYKNNSISIYLKEDSIDYEFLPALFLNNNIILTNSIDLFSEKFFYEWDGLSTGEADLLVKQTEINLDFYKPIIEEAFSILKYHFPNEYSKFLYSTKRIVLFSNPSLRNFSIRKAHGTIYLNVNEKSNVCFFLEEIIHQCSHTVFNAVTINIDDFFMVDPESLLCEYINEKDSRTLYGAFHGIYTTGKIVDLFIKLVNSKNDFDLEMKHEIAGRLAINKNRINIGLERVSYDQVFTKKGRDLFLKLNGELLENFSANLNLFNYSMSNHPVVFCYETFKNDNPISTFN